MVIGTNIGAKLAHIYQYAQVNLKRLILKEGLTNSSSYFTEIYKPNLPNNHKVFPRGTPILISSNFCFAYSNVPTNKL